MKVCFLAPELYPIWGGGGAYAVGLLKYLPKKVDVHVLAMRRNVPESKEDFSEEIVHGFFGNNVHIHFIASGSDTFFCHAKFQYQCYRWVLKLHEKYGFDVIHSQHQPMSDILLKFLSKKFCYVTTVHETFSRRDEAIRNSKIGFSELEFSEKWMLMLSPFLELIENFYMKKSPKLISPSNWMKNVLNEDFNFSLSDIYVVNNGVDHNKFHPKAKKSEFIQKVNDEAGGPIVLFSGRMISTKGVQVLVEAIPKIICEIKDAYFIFAGGGNSEPYRQNLKKLGIPNKNYNFLGYIPNFDDIPGLYSIASVFVAPTLYENFPIRILENMSCQNPVVATNIVGIPEMIENQVNGLLIPPWDANALSENVIKLLSDSALAKRIGQNARKTVEEKFTLQKFANQTAKVYKKVTDSYKNFTYT
jgi:glycosyltransferase involved in cell wall biosynthesis